MLTDSSALARFAESDLDVFDTVSSRTAAPVTPISGFASVATRPRFAEAVIAAAAMMALFSAMVLMNGIGFSRAAPHIVAVNLTLDPPAQKPPTPKPSAAPTETTRLETTPTPPMPQPAAQPIAAALPVTSAPSLPPAPPAPAPVSAPAPAPVAPAAPAEAGDMSSRMIAFTAPTYPVDSRRAHEEGTVVLTLLLGTDGRVSEIHVSRSSGAIRLDEAALSAVRKWRWAPVLRDGQPVMVRGTVRIPFLLR